MQDKNTTESTFFQLLEPHQNSKDTYWWNW